MFWFTLFCNLCPFVFLTKSSLFLSLSNLWPLSFHLSISHCLACNSKEGRWGTLRRMDHREGTLVISTPSCLPLSKPAPELPTDPTLSSPSSSSSSSAFFSPRASSSIPPYAHFYYILCVLLFCYFLILQNDTPLCRFGLFCFWWNCFATWNLILVAPDFSCHHYFSSNKVTDS